MYWSNLPTHIPRSPNSQQSGSRHEMRPMHKEKPLDEEKKLSLLAKLDAVDNNNSSPKSTPTNGINLSPQIKEPLLGYSPSFGPGQRKTSGGGDMNLAQRSETFSAKNAEGSLNSSVASVESRKSNLMKELFGDQQQDGRV